MQHCVGSYAEAVGEGGDIYSLRDPHNNPHATIEGDGKIIYQIKGKQNKPPVKKYVPYIRKFIEKFNFHSVGDLETLGLVDIDGKLYEINKLHKLTGLKAKGSLYLNNTSITQLPDNLEVSDDLMLYNTPITRLPDNLKVDGVLDISDTPLAKNLTQTDIQSIMRRTGATEVIMS